jgi:hypothetical protein
MGGVKIHRKPNYLILFNYFRVCGGDEGSETQLQPWSIMLLNNCYYLSNVSYCVCLLPSV